jgi:hypothetical protein
LIAADADEAELGGRRPDRAGDGGRIGVAGWFTGDDQDLKHATEPPLDAAS